VVTATKDFDAGKVEGIEEDDDAMKLTLKDAVSATLALAEAIQGNTESPEEVLRRATICLKCPKKTLTRGMLPRVAQRMGELSRKHDVPNALAGYMCGVCKCPLLNLIPSIKLPVDTSKQLSQRPTNCWLRQITENKLK